MSIQLADLIGHKTPEKYPKDKLLIYEGESTPDLYYIHRGYVKVYSILETGTERIIFIYAKGDVFPATSFLTSGHNARYFYEAMTDIETTRISGDEFADIIKGNIDAAEMIVAYTQEMNEQFLKRIDALSVNDARRKIVGLLSFLIEKVGSVEGSKSRLRIPLVQQDIADLCAITRETASIQLSKLAREKIIAENGRHLVIDRRRLGLAKVKLAINM